MPTVADYPQLQIIRDLAKRQKRQVYLVGGFLRNQKLGLSTALDFDFAVDRDALKLARSFARAVKGAFVLLDKEHGSARVVKSYEGRPWTFDFTDFRGKDIRQDLARRDFTVNTFCFDLADEKDCSPPQALKDLKACTIRMVSAKAFTDDPLRLMRAFSLAAQTGFKIEAPTNRRIQSHIHLINRAAMERIREEFFKILQSPRAYTTLAAMHKIGLLEKIIPQIAVMFGVKQGGYHHLDVWKHTLDMVRQLEDILPKLEQKSQLHTYLNEETGGGHSCRALLKLAALLHDIGKPETRKKEATRMTFHGHEHAGQRITRLVAKRLMLSVKERYFLEDVVRMHLRPGYLANFKRPTTKALFRYFRDTKEKAPAIAVLAMADQRATAGPLTTAAKARHHEKICQLIIEEYFKEAAKPQRLRLLSGHDLIKTLKLKPSPLFAEILGKVEEAQALGKVSTKDQALNLARSLCVSTNSKK